MIEMTLLKELMLIRQTNHYWYFLNQGFKFLQPYACNTWQDLLMISMNLSNIFILNIKGPDYVYNINRISKSEAINLMQSIKKLY